MVMSSVRTVRKKLYFIPTLETKVYPYGFTDWRNFISVLTQESSCPELLFNPPCHFKVETVLLFIGTLQCFYMRHLNLSHRY
jgi:hypothetical protein